MMKKIISVILLVTLMLSLMVGCSNNKDNDKGNDKNNDKNNHVEDDNVKVDGSYYSVLPGAKAFKNVDLTSYDNIPSAVQDVKSEKYGIGYVVKVEVNGYNPGMIVIVGISSDGIVTGATCLQSNETNGVEKTYGEKFVEKDINSVDNVDLISGSTLTTNAYRGAVKKALIVVAIISGNYTEDSGNPPTGGNEDILYHAYDVDLSSYQDNEIVKNQVNSVKKTLEGIYIVEIKTTGQYDFTTPIVLMVIIDANGCIIDVQTVSYGDDGNFGKAQLADGKYNVNFIGKDKAGASAVDIVAGVTFTTTAYKNAINNAFDVVTLLEDGWVDNRTEEEKFSIALSRALPEANGEFTKYFKVEAIEGVDTIYVADNGAGYVCVIGTDSTGTFIGVGADGVAVGENENNAVAEAAIAKVIASKVVDVDLTEFNDSATASKEVRKLFKKIKSVQLTESGNYIISVSCDGFGKKGDHYAGPSGKSFIIKVCISADGTILDAVTVEEYETPTIGGVLLEDGSYNSNFIGQDKTGAESVDLIADCTLTTDGFKTGVLNAFEAMAIIVNSNNEGGTN